MAARPCLSPPPCLDSRNQGPARWTMQRGLYAGLYLFKLLRPMADYCVKSPAQDAHTGPQLQSPESSHQPRVSCNTADAVATATQRWGERVPPTLPRNAKSHVHVHGSQAMTRFRVWGGRGRANKAWARDRPSTDDCLLLCTGPLPRLSGVSSIRCETASGRVVDCLLVALVCPVPRRTCPRPSGLCLITLPLRPRS